MNKKAQSTPLMEEFVKAVPKLIIFLFLLTIMVGFLMIWNPFKKTAEQKQVEDIVNEIQDLNANIQGKGETTIPLIFLKEEASLTYFYITADYAKDQTRLQVITTIAPKCKPRAQRLCVCINKPSTTTAYCAGTDITAPDGKLLEDVRSTMAPPVGPSSSFLTISPSKNIKIELDVGGGDVGTLVLTPMP